MINESIPLVADEGLFLLYCALVCGEMKKSVLFQVFIRRCVMSFRGVTSLNKICIPFGLRP